MVGRYWVTGRTWDAIVKHIRDGHVPSRDRCDNCSDGLLLAEIEENDIRRSRGARYGLCSECYEVLAGTTLTQEG